MKKIKYWFGIFILPMTLTGCFKDIGNYDYTDLNEISVNTVGEQVAFTVEQYDSLHIVPKLIFSQNPIPDDELSYEWLIFLDSYSATESQVISNEKELHIQVSYPAKIENYAILFYVKELTNNTVYQQKYTLTVQPSVVSGIVALHECDGECDIDYIATTNAVPGLASNKHMRNIYSARTGRKLEGNPVSVSAIRISNVLDPAAAINRVYVATDKEFVQLSGRDFSPMCDVDELFYPKPEVLKPYRVLRDGQVAHTTVLINDDKVHNINNQSSQFWNYTFSDALRADADLGEISIAPFIYMPESFMTSNIAVFYDMKGKRFVRLPYSFKESASITSFPTQVSTAFDVNNIGKDLIWFGIGYNAHCFALMSDYTLYRANFNTDQYILQEDGSTEVNEKVNDLAVRIYDMNNEPEIRNAKFFDCGEAGATTFLYATGRDIYVTSISGTRLRTVKINDPFPAGEEITHVQIYNPNTHQMGSLSSVKGNLLYVATWNGTEGKIYEFAVSRNTLEMNNTTSENLKAPLNVFGGMGRIADITIKIQGIGDSND